MPADRKVKLRRRELAAAAFVHDRAMQYHESSGVHAALLDVAAQLASGDHLEALDHGELDDLIKRYRNG